jgi:phosphatidylinositol alpha-1,6-mannosyltransferase
LSTLLLSFNFPPHGGGIARMMGELALRYPPHSLVVSTGTYPDAAASDARFPQEIDRVGIRATRLRTINGLALWTARAGRLARRHRFRFAWCGELKPAGYPAWWLAKRRGIPFGVVVHGTELLLLDAKIRRSRFKRWTAGGLVSAAAVLVANSTWTAELARRVYALLGRLDLAERVQVVPLGTEPSQFRPGLAAASVRTRYGLEGGPWLLTVSRLEWHKGIDTVIRALPAIRRAVPGARYAVAGVGPRQEQLAALARDHGVADALKLLGFVPEADLPALYNAADLYVGVSRYHDLLVEGFGISIVEASASGLAVVGGRSGGVPDAVRDGETGVLVDPEDAGAVAAAIVRLLADDALRARLGAAGRRAVETFYNWDRVCRDLLRIDAEFRRRGDSR